MNWNLFTPVDGGWTCTCSSDGWTLAARLYSMQDTVWPQLGDFVTVAGPCAVPARFVGFMLASIECEPLTKAGPYIFTVTARAKLPGGGSSLDSRLSQRSCRRERRAATIHRSQVSTWPETGSSKTESSLEFAVVDYFRSASTAQVSGVPHGIVRAFPAWMQIPSRADNRWRVFSASLSRETDNDGRSLIHVVAELAAAPQRFGGWNFSRYGLSTWNDF